MNRHLRLASRTFMVLVVLSFLLFTVLPTMPAWAATSTTTGSGNWNSTTPNAPWPGGTVPAAGDDVTIRPGDSITVTANATINSITFANTATTTGTLTVNSSVVLTVTAGITLQNAAGATNTAATIAGAGTINCTSVTLGGTIAPTASSTSTLTSTISTLSISGDLAIISQRSGSINNNNNPTFALSSGSVSVGGRVAYTTANNVNSIATLSMTGGAQSGTLTLSGATPFTNSGNNGVPTFTPAGTSATVVYSGGTQTVNPTTYTNLTLSGSGTKTTTTVTVNGILSMEGTATTTGTAPTFGAAATLQYKGSAAQTTGLEFVTPWVGTGGVKIENTSGVTLNAIKTINATSSLTIGSSVSNSVFNDGGFQLSSTGTLNLTSGTFKLGSAGTATTFPAFGTLNIAAGTTVEYAAGVAQTVSSIPNYHNLTVSGSSTKTLGGAVNVNGNLSIGAGTTLDVSTSNYGLIVKGNWSNSGTFTARSGTVTLGGLTTQAISGSSSTNFFNLTANNVNGVTLNSSPTISGTLTLTSGKITTGANTLIIATGGSISGGSNSSYVNGNLQKAFNSGVGQSFTFTIGNASAYTPVTLASMNVSTSGNLTVHVTSGDHPNIATSDINATMSVNRYWTLTSGGGFAATYNATFNYLSGDLDSSAVASAFVVRRYSSGAWSASTVSGIPTTTATTISGETGFGDFAIGNANSPPSISTVGLYQTDHTTSVTAMSPQIEYAIKVTVSNTGTLAILDTVKVTIFYDADGVYAPGDVPSSSNTQTAAILTRTVSGTPSWSISPGTNTTWSIIQGNSVEPALTNTTGDFWFHFKAGKVATATTGNARWHIYAKATSAVGTANNHQDNRTMNWYGEVTVNTTSVNFGTVSLGSDFSANPQTGISVTYISNGNYNQQVKVSSPWTGGGNLVLLNAAGSPGEGEFSLKADDTATLGSAVLVSTSYITIDIGTQTSESGNTESTNTLWLKLGALGLPAVTYNGIIFYGIAQ
ncbi:MAG: hypothetical protein Q7J73_09645 [Dehalococcoidales bacterium]|nr:hypothetical protein [Dehalococcoidales bacterium]